MKRFLLVCILLATGLTKAQGTHNPFGESDPANENQVKRFSDNGVKDVDADPPKDPNPGNPGGGDDLPIDDYLPLLLLTATGIIFYTVRKKAKTIS